MKLTFRTRKTGLMANPQPEKKSRVACNIEVVVQHELLQDSERNGRMLEYVWQDTHTDASTRNKKKHQCQTMGGAARCEVSCPFCNWDGPERVGCEVVFAILHPWSGFVQLVTINNKKKHEKGHQNSFCAQQFQRTNKFRTATLRFANNVHLTERFNHGLNSRGSPRGWRKIASRSTSMHASLPAMSSIALETRAVHSR